MPSLRTTETRREVLGILGCCAVDCSSEAARPLAGGERWLPPARRRRRSRSTRRLSSSRAPRRRSARGPPAAGLHGGPRVWPACRQFACRSPSSCSLRRAGHGRIAAQQWGGGYSLATENGRRAGTGAARALAPCCTPSPQWLLWARARRGQCRRRACCCASACEQPPIAAPRGAAAAAADARTAGGRQLPSCRGRGLLLLLLAPSSCTGPAQLSSSQPAASPPRHPPAHEHARPLRPSPLIRTTRRSSARTAASPSATTRTRRETTPPPPTVSRRSPMLTTS